VFHKSKIAPLPRLPFSRLYATIIKTVGLHVNFVGYIFVKESREYICQISSRLWLVMVPSLYPFLLVIFGWIGTCFNISLEITALWYRSSGCQQIWNRQNTQLLQHALTVYLWKSWKPTTLKLFHVANFTHMSWPFIIS